jgi:hypothetical protein
MFAAGAAVTVQTRDLFLNKLVSYLKANRVNAGFPELSLYLKCIPFDLLPSEK